MKKALWLFFTLSVSTVFAQKADSTQNYKDSVYFYNTSSKLQIDYHISIGANTATMGALQSFFLEDFLDDNKKEDLTKNLKSENKFGIFTSIGGHYQTAIDTIELKQFIGFSLNAHYRNLYYGNLSQDLVETILFGNKRFAGQTAVIGPSSYNNYRFTEFGAKYHTNFKGKNTFFTAHVGANLLLGHEYKMVDIERGNLFTETDGEEVRLDIKLEGHQSDTNSTGVFDVNGIGASFNLGFNAEIDKKHIIHFNLSDLGFISWNSESLNAVADTTINFQGFVIDNLFDLTDSIFNPKADSLENAVYGQTKGKHTSSLPPLLKLGYTQLLEKKGNLKAISAYTMYRFNASYTPYIEAAAHFQFNKSHNLSPSLSFGGYNRFGLGLKYMYSAYSWQAIISTNNLQSLILPNNSYGIGVFVALRRNL